MFLSLEGNFITLRWAIVLIMKVHETQKWRKTYFEAQRRQSSGRIDFSSFEVSDPHFIPVGNFPLLNRVIRRGLSNLDTKLLSLLTCRSVEVKVWKMPRKSKSGPEKFAEVKGQIEYLAKQLTEVAISSLPSFMFFV